MDQLPRLSIITANWNTRQLLNELLHSLYVHPPRAPFEVIVVDNGSRDGSVEMIRSEFAGVRLVCNEVNRGFARANNQGASIARGEFLLLLGSDTMVCEGSVNTMMEHIIAHPEVGAVACRLLNPDGSIQHSCRRFPTLWDGVLTYLSLGTLARRYNMTTFDYSATQEVEQPAATCFMLRRSLVRESGLFDEQLSILYNDVDLCEHILSQGWKINYVAAAEIIHHGTQSTRRAPPRLRLEMYRNILLYYGRHSGPWSALILRPILGVRLMISSRSLIGLQLLWPDHSKELP